MGDTPKVPPEQPKPVAAPLRGILRNDGPVAVAASGGDKGKDGTVVSGEDAGTVLWCFKIKIVVLQLQPLFVLVLIWSILHGLS